MRILPGCILAAAALAALGGCERAMHDMYDQPKYKPLARSTLFADQRAARTPPKGAIAHSSGVEADLSSGRAGRLDPSAPVPQPMPLDDSGHAVAGGAVAAGAAPDNPLTPTLAVLRRGRERFDIYCAPCHGADGDGHGRVVERGFPAPPSYHIDRLRNAPDAHLFEVMTHGYGVMYPYADRVSATDRWAIVAYIRALQLSRHAPVDALDEVDLAKLRAAATEGKQR